MTVQPFSPTALPGPLEEVCAVGSHVSLPAVPLAVLCYAGGCAPGRFWGLAGDNANASKDQAWDLSVFMPLPSRQGWI